MIRLNYLQQNSPEKYLFKRWRKINKYYVDMSCDLLMLEYVDRLYDRWYNIYNESN